MELRAYNKSIICFFYFSVPFTFKSILKLPLCKPQFCIILLIHKIKSKDGEYVYIQNKISKKNQTIKDLKGFYILK